ATTAPMGSCPRLRDATSAYDPPMTITTALFDFGGVILSSPFEAFARYEDDHGLPPDFIRTVNATNPDANAWARLERSELDLVGFDDAFHDESTALGHPVRGAVVLDLLVGDVRPAMVEAVRRCAARLKTGLLTNNVTSMSAALDPGLGEILGLFDV